MDDYKQWYDEAIEASNECGFAGMSAAQVIQYQDAEIKRLRDALTEIRKTSIVAHHAKLTAICVREVAVQALDGVATP